MSNKYHQFTCYACDRKSETGEHAPPQSFFPHVKKDKLLLGMDYKKKLIKEPSCFTHNGAKAEDDYFFKNIIYSVFDLNNPLADFVRRGSIQQQFDNNQMRKIRKLFGDSLLVNSQQATVIDITRFKKYVVDMARVFYYKQYERLRKITEKDHPPSTFQMVTNFLMDPTQEHMNELQLKVLKEMKINMSHVDFSEHCYNLEVFKFKIVETENTLNIYMQFYEQLDIILMKKLS